MSRDVRTDPVLSQRGSGRCPPETYGNFVPSALRPFRRYFCAICSPDMPPLSGGCGDISDGIIVHVVCMHLLWSAAVLVFFCMAEGKASRQNAKRSSSSSSRQHITPSQATQRNATPSALSNTNTRNKAKSKSKGENINHR